MKLKNKLLVPLFGTIAAAGVIAPVVTSCGNNEKKDGGKISITREGIKEGVTISASKDSFTKEEAKTGFTVSFTYAAPELTLVYPAFTLKRIMLNGVELSKEKDYTVKYDATEGISGEKFDVTINPDVATDDLEFVVKFSDYNAVPIENEYQGSGDLHTATCHPDTADLADGWQGELLITSDNNEYIKITSVYIMYGNKMDDLQAHHLAEADYEEVDHPAEDHAAEVDLNELGFARLTMYWTLFDFVKIQINWMLDDQS